MARAPDTAASAPADQLVPGICKNPTLKKLSEMSKLASGLRLVVLLRLDHETVALCPSDGEEGLPEYCRVFRSSPEGRRRCRTTRALLAFGACCRGLIEYACHGGNTVIAAPAVFSDGATSQCVVVAACAFAARSHDKGWRAVGEHCRDMGVDLRALKRAYHALPPYADDAAALAKTIVDAAAAAIGEAATRWKPMLPCAKGRSGNAAGQAPALSSAPLALARDPGFRREGEPSGSALVDLVTAMVKRDPSMDYTVANIARAACLTPNHFSTLFRKHAGQSFKQFLLAERIARACTLLADPALSVAEVASRAGFEDAAYFSRRFKRAMGQSPTAWRNRPQ